MGQTWTAPRLVAPALEATRPAMGGAKASGDFKKDFVDGFPLGNGAVDDFAVNVIVHDDVLCGTGFFGGPGYIERRQPSQEVEDLSGDFEHVSVQATPISIPEEGKPDCRNCK